MKYIFAYCLLQTKPTGELLYRNGISTNKTNSPIQDSSTIREIQSTIKDYESKLTGVNMKDAVFVNFSLLFSIPLDPEIV